MQIDAIYENGIIKPQIPLQLKQKKVKVQVVIPDEAIEHNPQRPRNLRNKINAILGSYGHPRQATTPEQDKTAWHEHLLEKYGK